MNELKLLVKILAGGMAGMLVALAFMAIFPHVGTVTTCVVVMPLAILAGWKIGMS